MVKAKDEVEETTTENETQIERVDGKVDLVKPGMETMGAGGFCNEKKNLIQQQDEEEGEELSVKRKYVGSGTQDATHMPPPDNIPRPHCPNAYAYPPAQLTIFYSGKVCVFDAVPAEKVQAIMFIAAAASTTCNNTENGGIPSATATPVLTRSPSLQSTAAVVASSPNLLQSIQSTSLCKLQAELPIARRHSLQRFLEKRRDRLVSKSPYPPSTPVRAADSKESSYCTEASNQMGCFSEKPKSQDERPRTIAAYLASV